MITKTTETVETEHFGNVELSMSEFDKILVLTQKPSGFDERSEQGEYNDDDAEWFSHIVSHITDLEADDIDSVADDDAGSDLVYLLECCTALLADSDVRSYDEYLEDVDGEQKDLFWGEE